MQTFARKQNRLRTRVASELAGPRKTTSGHAYHSILGTATPNWKSQPTDVAAFT